MKQYLGFSRDHSRSMYNITRPAARDYNDNISAVQEAARLNNLDTIVSVVKCGVGMPAEVVREVVNSNVQVLQPIPESSYIADGAGTPLWDSVGELIEIMAAAPDANDPAVSFLIMAITDGEENSSKRWPTQRISSKIQELQASDRWTFVFRVPRGYAARLTRFGIHPGNILEWDQTERGVEVASAATRSAFTSYYTNRSQGATSTNKFYADLSTVSIKEVRNNLVDISNQIRRYFVVPESNGVAIKSFMEQHDVPYQIGTVFYQLTKTEKVQPSKNICICDKTTRAVYSGAAARDLLGLPHGSYISLAPHKLGNYDVYIQSTSVNRKLVGGTTILYWLQALI